jgi:hypothetical protein
MSLPSRSRWGEPALRHEQAGKRIVHVRPAGDTFEHEIDGKPCPCAPSTERCGDGLIVIHDAMDGRK